MCAGTVVEPAGGTTPAPAIRIAATGSTAGAPVQADIADVLLGAYRAAVTRSPAGCHLPVSLLAAIGQVESGSLVGRPIDRAHRTSVLGPVLDGKGFAAIPDTDAGRWDGDATWDRAVGPMQFVPGSWRTFGVDADGDGVANPQDVEDAAAGTASYLCYGGRDLSDPVALRTSILSYNHSVAYLRLVLTYQQRFARLGLDNGTTVAGLPTHLALSAVEVASDAWASARVSAHATRHARKAAHKHSHHAKARASAKPSPTASAAPSPSSTSTPLAAAPPATTTPAGPTPLPTLTGDPTPSSDPGSPSADPAPENTCPTAPSDPTATPSPTDQPSATPSDAPTATPTSSCPPCPEGTDPTEQEPCQPSASQSTEPSTEPSTSTASTSPSAATSEASPSSAP